MFLEENSTEKVAGGWPTRVHAEQAACGVERGFEVRQLVLQVASLPERHILGELQAFVQSIQGLVG